jgi:hypothetical protein
MAREASAKTYTAVLGCVGATVTVERVSYDDDGARTVVVESIDTHTRPKEGK